MKKRPNGRPKLPFEVRFWSKVRIPEVKDACWEWQSTLEQKMGYGRFEAFGEHYAHRISWITLKGPIPKGMMVLHSCDNGRCVRPNHLFLGNHQDNMDDCKQKGRRPRAVGENNSRAKLSWKTVRTIRKRIANGELQSAVADDMGIVRTLVNKIWHNQIWKIEDDPKKY